MKIHFKSIFAIFFVNFVVNAVTASSQLFSGDLKWYLENLNNTNISFGKLYGDGRVQKILQEIQSTSEKRILNDEFCETEKIVYKSLEFYKEVIKTSNQSEIEVYMNIIERLVHYSNGVRNFCNKLTSDVQNHQYTEITKNDLSSKSCSYYDENGKANHLVSLYGDFLNETMNTLKEVPAQVFCNKDQTYQAYLYKMYEIVVEKLVHNHLLKVLQLHRCGLSYDSDEESLQSIKYLEKIHQEFKKDLMSVIDHTKQTLQLIPREYWKCDLPNSKSIESRKDSIKGIEAFNFGLYYGHFVQEACSESDLPCDAQKAMRKCLGRGKTDKECHGYLPFRCNGYLENCDFISREIDYCFEPKDDSSCLHYLKYRTHEWGSRNNHWCDKNFRHKTLTVGNFLMIGLINSCNCVYEDNKLNRINLKSATADVENNKVITGVRFTHNDKMISIQIQQGKLGARGLIESNSVEWVPIKYPSSIAYNRTYSPSSLKDSLEFFTVGPESNKVYLNSQGTPKDHVMIGIKFDDVYDFNDQDRALILRIRYAPYDFLTGKVDFRSAKWMDNQFDAESWSELKLSNAQLPRLEEFDDSYMISSTNQFFRFQQSDLENHLGHDTVPFLDMQPVVPSPRYPLTGVGLYIKGTSKGGTFLGLKVVTEDLSLNL